MAKKKVARKTANKSAVSKTVSNNFCNMYGKGCNSGGCSYGLGVLGALVYYISTANTFGAGVLGFLKALVWPAFLVFELLKFLGA